MKTAISVPDDVFAHVEQHAAALGVSRSEFFTSAVRRYIDLLDAESLTARIDRAVDVAWPDQATVDAVQHSRRRLDSSDDEW